MHRPVEDIPDLNLEATVSAPTEPKQHTYWRKLNRDGTCAVHLYVNDKWLPLEEHFTQLHFTLDQVMEKWNKAAHETEVRNERDVIKAFFKLLNIETYPDLNHN